jgi:hypothetical protein
MNWLVTYVNILVPSHSSVKFVTDVSPDQTILLFTWRGMNPKSEPPGWLSRRLFGETRANVSSDASVSGLSIIDCLFDFLYPLTIMCIYVLRPVLWCPLRFPHKSDVRFVFISSCLWDGSCPIYVICVQYPIFIRLSSFLIIPFWYHSLLMRGNTLIHFSEWQQHTEI